MSAMIRRHHILLLLALHGCAAEVPVYTPPPARPAEDLGMDNTSQNAAQQGRASGGRGMTYDELLACANDKAGITGQQKKLHTQLGGINALKNAIDAEGAAIETSRRLVDARSENQSIPSMRVSSSIKPRCATSRLMSMPITAVCPKRTPRPAPTASRAPTARSANPIEKNCRSNCAI